jgi:ATP-dependent 26S proteasome regulatory subunit
LEGFSIIGQIISPRNLVNLCEYLRPFDIMALAGFYESKIETAEREITQKASNLRRLEAQRYQLNNRVRRLKEELQLLQQPASYVGEVIKTMGKKKVLVKCHPEGKYGISQHGETDSSCRYCG